MNVKARLESELTYFEAALKDFSIYTTETFFCLLLLFYSFESFSHQR